MGCFGLSGCIEEYSPQSNIVTSDQAAQAPGSFDKFVDAITSPLAGQFNYWPAQKFGFDYGYTSFFLARDVAGQDIAPTGLHSMLYSSWYSSSSALGPAYAVCQFPWTDYYGWINNCNIVLKMAGAEPSETQKAGVGIAYAMRAMFYMDLARMFAQKTYALDKEAITVPIVTDETADLAHNPRATNEEMWRFILSDLDKAENYIAGYNRSDKYTPDLSVVYGLKARAYLTMEDWANAESYAKKAQAGYTVLNESEYTDNYTGFNTPNDSWMLAVRFRSTDDNITENDGDTSWGTVMCLEVQPKIDPETGDDGVGCGYASNYGYANAIDRHLFETIPATDFRKKVFVDFAIDDLADQDAKVKALEAYSKHPLWLLSTAANCQSDERRDKVGGLSLKFRLAGNEEGRYDQYKGYLVSVPLMRVEEMKLIEAEAAGMQDESRGIQLLTDFAKTRDAKYEYGKHNEAYGNTSTSKFRNEVWWQRRVELWGEGFATFDIKRLNKGVIRSYKNTNHLETYRWNTTTPPDWMNWCITSVEADNNFSIINNPTPVAPTTDSPEYAW